VSKRLEGQATNGHHGAIWEALPALSILLERMESGISETQIGSTRSGSSPLAIAYQNAWEKLRKYYELTDLAHGIYGAAVLLHPSHRKHYFDHHWQGNEEAWKDVMIGNVKRVWEQEYRPQPAASTRQEQSLGLVEEFFQRTQAPQKSDDAFDAYINSPPVAFLNADDVISWFINTTTISPGIKQQALDLLSIPAMSAELERVFSQAKLTITPARNRLSEYTIEMLELLRHWWVNNIVAQQRGGGGRVHRKRKPIIPIGGDSEGYSDSEVTNTTG
jgi:hAT family C-terminal dimerisation region